MSYNLHYAKSMKNGDTLREDAAAGFCRSRSRYVRGSLLSVARYPL